MKKLIAKIARLIKMVIKICVLINKKQKIVVEKIMTVKNIKFLFNIN